MEGIMVGLPNFNHDNFRNDDALLSVALNSDQSVCLFRISPHSQSWVQKPSSVSTGYRVFSTAEHYTDVYRYWDWDLL